MLVLWRYATSTRQSDSVVVYCYTFRCIINQSSGNSNYNMIPLIAHNVSVRQSIANRQQLCNNYLHVFIIIVVVIIIKLNHLTLCVNEIVHLFFAIYYLKILISLTCITILVCIVIIV